MEYIFGLISVLFGSAVFLYIRGQSAQALLDNLKTKEKLNESDKDIANKQGNLQAESDKRNDLAKDLNQEKGKDETLENLKDFFNTPPNK
jgi:hypothetical protein